MHLIDDLNLYLSNKNLQKYLKTNLSYQRKPVKMNKPMKIQSKMNGMALTLAQGQHNSRAGDLIASVYYGGLKQKWSLGSDNQNFTIKNLLNNYVLDVENASTQIYVGILCYKYHGDDNQLWKLRKYKNYPDVFYIQNAKSGLVLQIEGGIDAEGMRIVQNKFYGNLNQLWMITQADQ